MGQFYYRIVKDDESFSSSKECFLGRHNENITVHLKQVRLLICIRAGRNSFRVTVMTYFQRRRVTLNTNLHIQEQGT